MPRRASVWTQARRLDQVEATVREAIALALDTDQDSFDVNIEPVVPDGIRREVELARSTAHVATLAQAMATSLNQHAAQQRYQAKDATSESAEFDSVVESLLEQLLAAMAGLTVTSSPAAATAETDDAEFSTPAESARGFGGGSGQGVRNGSVTRKPGNALKSRSALKRWVTP